MDSDEITTKIIIDYMKLNEATEKELAKIEDYTFNIFNVQSHTTGQELESTIAYIFAKEGIFEEVPNNKQKFFPYIK